MASSAATPKRNSLKRIELDGLIPIQVSGTLANRFPILILFELTSFFISVFVSSAVPVSGWPRDTNCTRITPATRVMITTVFLLFICTVTQLPLPVGPVRQHDMNFVPALPIPLLKIQIPNRCIYILQIPDRKHISLLAGDHQSAVDIAQL